MSAHRRTPVITPQDSDTTASTPAGADGSVAPASAARRLAERPDVHLAIPAPESLPAPTAAGVRPIGGPAGDGPVAEAPLPNVALMLGEGLRLAIATALLYFMGFLYVQTYAEVSGLPIDVFALPGQALLLAPWQTLFRGVWGALYLGWILLPSLYFLARWRLRATARAERWRARRADRRRARNRPAAGEPGREVAPSPEARRLDAQAHGVALRRLLWATGFVAMAILGAWHAGRMGKRAGREAVDRCEAGVKIALAKDAPPIELGTDARYCGKWGPDHLFVRPGALPGARVVVVVKESQVSSIERPLRPKSVP